MELEPGYIIVQADGRVQMRLDKPKGSKPDDPIPEHLLFTSWLYLYFIEHADEILGAMPDNPHEIVDRLQRVAHRQSFN